MKPDWDKLMKLYEEDNNILVADVDCTASGKDLCEEIGVEGFPTIKHGDPSDLEDYEGGRDFQSLKEFAKENLGPRCSPANLEKCDADQKKMVDEFMAMPIGDLQNKIKEQEEATAAAGKELDELLKSLQEQYEEGQTKSEAQKKRD